MKIIVTLLLLVSSSFGQGGDLPPCHTYKHINLPAHNEIVESIFQKKFNLKKKVTIFYESEEILYFYKGLLFRIEIRNKKLSCPYNEDGYYFDDDIKVYYDKDLDRTSIMSIKLWMNLIKDE